MNIEQLRAHIRAQRARDAVKQEDKPKEEVQERLKREASDIYDVDDDDVIEIDAPPKKKKKSASVDLTG